MDIRKLDNRDSDNGIPDYETDFVDESHMKAFAEALEYEDEPSGYQTPSSEIGSGGHHDGFGGKNNNNNNNNNNNKQRKASVTDTNGNPVELITSNHDWLPVYKKLKKKDKFLGSSSSSPSSGISSPASFAAKVSNLNSSDNANSASDKLRFSKSFQLFRFPLLFLIYSWISFLFIIYLILRMYVALYETIFAWRGQKRNLRKKIRNSKNYEEWTENAKKLDSYLGLDSWKNDDKFFYYDYKTLKKTVKNLKYYRKNNKIEELFSILQSCVKENFAGTENPLLYSNCYYALIDNDLLPNIISGTSGGGLVAALACTRTNEELSKILQPDLANKITACNESLWVCLKRFWKTGARFDAVDWAKKSAWFTKGSLTFQEAYERTGKILNISTVPSDPHSPVILCNNITSPGCVIWSSLLASAAVPGILNPVVLMMKDTKDKNKIVPFSFGNRWRDGSLRTDIPVEALNNYFNVKFTIVSQVNPHISLFFYAPKGSVGRPVTRRRKDSLRGGFFLATLEHLIKLEIRKWLKLVKSMDLLPRIMNQDWSNIWLQRFSGTITLWPRVNLVDFYYILSDPTPERLSVMLRNGQLSVFPKLLFIKHRLNIERCIEKGKKRTREQIRASSSAAVTDAANRRKASHSPRGRKNSYFTNSDIEMVSELIDGVGIGRIPVDDSEDDDDYGSDTYDDISKQKEEDNDFYDDFTTDSELGNNIGDISNTSSTGSIKIFGTTEQPWKENYKEQDNDDNDNDKDNRESEDDHESDNYNGS
ncbi:hypothetical protein PACTADRAFT_49509 [Pachysolen tannophilus NRRL Y-2460]|uniref:Patatin-like phospholipase domain-containing protein n=1 Tax=Pachysolen tannophilus NRRL Y-2460 TaxID=669874 RepID=A0A1E4TWI7_PACTA|nr:hypothetical protein PACTADRAFT_49509 [Pachysolen tannophilus NRRL Y-2460]